MFRGLADNPFPLMALICDILAYLASLREPEDGNRNSWYRKQAMALEMADVLACDNVRVLKTDRGVC
jgi:hypothetical protein